MGRRPLVRVLLTGWFSFEDAEVTAGDLLARDTVAAWLREAGIPCDAAVASTFRQPGEADLTGRSSTWRIGSGGTGGLR